MGQNCILVIRLKMTLGEGVGVGGVFASACQAIFLDFKGGGLLCCGARWL